MTVSTFFPDGHPESTSVDGIAQYLDGAGQNWSTIRGQSTGTDAAGNAEPMALVVRADANTNKWDRFDRGYMLFDTSALPDGDSISAATVSFVCDTGTRTDDFTDSLSLITTSPASDTEIATADYDQVGTTKQATDLTLAGLTVDSSSYNVFTCNAAGLASISKTGITKFGMVMTSDTDNSEPTWSSGKSSRIDVHGSEESEGGDVRVKLVVTHESVIIRRVSATMF
jgi:hypothetical protein